MLLVQSWQLAASRRAAAQEEEAGEVAGELRESEEARAHFQSGVDSFREQDWENALREFQKAFDLKPHWKIRYNIGLCYLKLEFWAQAMTEMILMLEEGGENVPSKQYKKVRKMIESLEGKVGTLRIEGDISKARVHVDGKPVVKLAAGGVVFLNPGEHRVEISFGERLGKAEDIVLTGGQEKTLEVDVPVEPPTLPEKEEETGAAPAPEIEKTEPRRSKRLLIAGSTLAAMAGASLAGGGAAGVVAIIHKKKQEEAYDAGDKEKIDSHYDRARKSAHSATALFSAGGGLALAALVVILVSKKKKEKKKTPGFLPVPLRDSLFMTIVF